MEGLLASVVLIAILLGVLLVVAGLVYLLAQRLRKRSAEPMTRRPRPLLGSKAWYGPARAEHSRSPASPEGHAVAVVAIAGAVYLDLAGQILGAAVIAAALVIIVFLKSTSPGGARERQEFQARTDQRPGPPGRYPG